MIKAKTKRELMKRSKSEMHLVNRATAYRRLAWKRGIAERQRKLYLDLADRLTRQADAIRDRRLVANGYEATS